MTRRWAPTTPTSEFGGFSGRCRHRPRGPSAVCVVWRGRVRGVRAVPRGRWPLWGQRSSPWEPSRPEVRWTVMVGCGPGDTHICLEGRFRPSGRQRPPRVCYPGEAAGRAGPGGACTHLSSCPWSRCHPQPGPRLRVSLPPPPASGHHRNGHLPRAVPWAPMDSEPVAHLLCRNPWSRPVPSG